MQVLYKLLAINPTWSESFRDLMQVLYKLFAIIHT